MKVKVFNDDVKEYVEEYKGEIIKIPAKGFIIMERGEAAGFMGTFRPIKVDPVTGDHVNLKKLRKEFIVENNKVEETKIEEPLASPLIVETKLKKKR